MSIPSYQLRSLAGDNIAKKRVMEKAKKGFETEEQRAIKSGNVDANIKSIYESIIANLRLQLSTIATAEAFIRVSMDDATLTSQLISVLGKLTFLSSQTLFLLKQLADKMREAGKSSVPSGELSKISLLMDDVDEAYGEWNERKQTGLKGAFADMVQHYINEGLDVPQIEELLRLLERNKAETRALLTKLQNNEYGADLKQVRIPHPSGKEKKAKYFTGQEEIYKMLAALRDEGLIDANDFGSILSDETLSFAEDSDEEESDSDSDLSFESGSQLGSDLGSVSTGSNSSFNRFLQGTLQGYGLSGAGLYSIPQQPKRLQAFPLRYY